LAARQAKNATIVAFAHSLAGVSRRRRWPGAGFAGKLGGDGARRTGELMESPFRVISSVPAFGAVWVSSFLFAIFALFAGNFVFHLGLPEMVDGELAVQLVLMAAAEAFFLGLTLFSLVRGDFAHVFRFAGQVLAYLLHVFPALLAYDLYASLAGQTLVGRARIYDAVLNGVDGVLGLGGHRIVSGLNLFMSVDRKLAEPTAAGLRLFAIVVSLMLAAYSLAQLTRQGRARGETAAAADEAA
jgi:hypothetical protein